MKINEIITESRGQLDEGVMDTIKSKLSGVYQKLNKMPGFNKVAQQVKSHSGEVNKIAQVLQAKSQDGQLTKQDVLATVMPLANEVSSEMGGDKVGQPDSPMLDSLVNTLISSLSGSKQAVQESKMVLKEDTAFGIGLIVMLIIGIWALGNLNTGREKQEKVEKVKAKASEADHQELIKNIKEKYKGEPGIKGVCCGMSESEVKTILGTAKPSPSNFTLNGLTPKSVTFAYDQTDGHLYMMYITMKSKEQWKIDPDLSELVDLIEEKNHTSRSGLPDQYYKNDNSYVYLGRKKGRYGVLNIYQDREKDWTEVRFVFTSEKYNLKSSEERKAERSKKLDDL